MTGKVVVVDYGVGNLLSVTRALDHVGAEVVQTRRPAKIEDADRVLLPGVGAFGDGMGGLAACGLIEPIRRFAERGRPFLGICLGMQMMLEESAEFGRNPGLGLIPGKVVPVAPTGADGTPHKIPHIGWNRLDPAAGRNGWDDTILAGLPADAAGYFVHSFMAAPTAARDRLADCDYDGRPITAAIARGSLYGCQFHPEKSGPVGLKILENFVAL
jgi:glutamine amidotransferase